MTELLRAELIGSDRCIAAGITAPGHAPVLRLCRRLIEAGAKLAVDESRSPRLVRYRMQEGALFWSCAFRNCQSRLGAPLA